MNIGFPSLLLAAVAMTGLAACSETTNRSVETVKAPVIQTQQIVYDLRFDAGNSLSPAQARALEEYLTTIGIGYGDRLSIDDPLAAGAATRRGAVEAILAKFGLMLSPAGALTEGSMAPGHARLVIARAHASVPGCPDWRRVSTPEFEASAMSNYGCAMRGNLAEMVADPNDLLHGRAHGGVDAHMTTKAIGVLREMKPTGADGLDRRDIQTTSGR